MSDNVRSKQTAYAASSSLGERSDYARTYDPELLHPVERAAYRDTLDLPAQKTLPAMSGADFWRCFEVSWLTSKGQPQFACARFRVDAGSAHIVESKSLKLYLNSLNQMQFDGAEALCRTVSGDVAAVCGAQVNFELFDAGSSLDAATRAADTAMQAEAILIDDRHVACNNYQRDAAMLRCGETHTDREWLQSRLLRSNCPVTAQPDWAQLDICYTGQRLDRDSLLQYIASYREHCGFHEQTVEQIYCDLVALQGIAQAAVLGRYTRRGGIAINVLRATPGYETALHSAAGIATPGQ